MRLIESRLPGPDPWPVKLISTSAAFERFSEYLLYGAYVSNRKKGMWSRPALRAHAFDAYGKRGLRLYGAAEAKAKGRTSNEDFINELNAEGAPITGYCYEKVAAQVSHLGLTHLQMEHVLSLNVGAAP
uniref:Uncharacterized protein n=1 Tax=Alexandrium andersonii TaxID=327968 RepID=A0A7S2GFM9_9DINO